MAEKTRFFNGKRYYLDSKGYYSASRSHTTRDKDRRKLHQAVWEHHHGKIPPGMVIHHIDGDKTNNTVYNLCLIDPVRHMVECHISNIELAREAAKRWHASPTGIQWHRGHSREIWRHIKAKRYHCILCGKEFESRKQSGALFCCSAHKTYHRQRSGVDDIDASCPVCSAAFRTNRYSPKKTCSKKCAGILSSRSRKNKPQRKRL